MEAIKQNLPIFLTVFIPFYFVRTEEFHICSLFKNENVLIVQ